MAGFIQELHRRRVFRVSAAYGVVAFVIINTLAGASAYYELAPSWVTTAIVAAVLLFPVVAITAWFFDYTPWGVLKTPARGELADAPTGLLDHRIEMVIIFVLLVLLGISLRGAFEDFAAQDAAQQRSYELAD